MFGKRDLEGRLRGPEGRDGTMVAINFTVCDVYGSPREGGGGSYLGLHFLAPPGAKLALCEYRGGDKVGAVILR